MKKVNSMADRERHNQAKCYHFLRILSRRILSQPRNRIWLKNWEICTAFNQPNNHLIKHSRRRCQITTNRQSKICWVTKPIICKPSISHWQVRFNIQIWKISFVHTSSNLIKEPRSWRNSIITFSSLNFRVRLSRIWACWTARWNWRNHRISETPTYMETISINWSKTGLFMTPQSSVPRDASNSMKKSRGPSSRLRSRTSRSSSPSSSTSSVKASANQALPRPSHRSTRLRTSSAQIR